MKDDDLVVTTLGWVAGEWFALRHKESNLYQVNMGMCTPLCLGLALVLPHRRVIAIESDGSVLLNIGAMTTLANKRPANLTVIVFDNQCYMATGGLPTATAGPTDLAGMANAAGIETLAPSPRSKNSKTKRGQRFRGRGRLISSLKSKRPAKG